MKYLAYIVYYPLTWVGTLLLCIAGLLMIITDFISEKLDL